MITQVLICILNRRKLLIKINRFDHFNERLVYCYLQFTSRQFNDVILILMEGNNGDRLFTQVDRYY